jgi:hypothetical protein
MVVFHGEYRGHASNSLGDRYEGERVGDRTQTIQRQNCPTCGIYDQCAEFSCFYHKFFFSTFLMCRFFFFTGALGGFLRSLP